MQALLASLPIALLIVLMAGLGWRAASAGLLGLLLALVLAVTVFGLGSAIYPDLGIARATGGAMTEALFTTGLILWIIFPALCIYESQARSGSFEVIRKALARLSEDPRILVLLVAWFFGLFMEGVAGFGTPVALAAPILVGLGIPPIRAVTLALIGHAAGVSFGAIGTPLVPQMAATGRSGIALAQPTALLHAFFGWALVAVLFAMSAEGWPRLRDWRWPALAALLFFVPSVVLASRVGPELPTIGAAIIGGALFAIIVHRGGATTSAHAVSARDLSRAALPYVVLLPLILSTRLLPPLRETLREVAWEWTLFDRFTGQLEPLYHPGTLLFVGFIAGGLLQGRSAAELLEAMAAAARRLLVVALALAAMLGLSRVLVHASMTEVLAEAAASSGALWPLLAPLVGALGTFITGSATSSNILFAEFQEATATTLSLPVAPLQAAQGVGAAIGNSISPHNIIAGAATVGLAGAREGEVMRATILVCLLYALAAGLATLFIASG